MQLKHDKLEQFKAFLLNDVTFQMNLFDELTECVLWFEYKIIGVVGMINTGNGIDYCAAQRTGVGFKENRLQHLKCVYIPYGGATR